MRLGLFCTSATKISVCFLLAVLVLISQTAKSEPMQSRDQERALAFVLESEADDYALEARKDVCIGFATNLSISQRDIFKILNGKGLRFHTIEWCNHGPRGVTISVDRIIKTGPSIYEIRSQIADSDPIRLYGEHFATLLRSGTYTVRCEKDSTPVISSYQETCCTSVRQHQEQIRK